MKRIALSFLALVMMLSLVACGGESGKKVELSAVYEELCGIAPEMILIEDANMRLNLLGIQEDDCVQVITAVCADGLRTDEIWLIEAKDAAALERIQALAENRLFAKGEESITYSPEQYAIVQKAETVTAGQYFALLVSPDVDAMKTVAESALN